MGYRSDVAMMAVFANAEQHDEVMAVYAMNPSVQKRKLVAEWRRVDLRTGEVVRIYEGINLKWYVGYEFVDGMEALASVLADFHENRGFDYAWGFARIGEDSEDVTYDLASPGTDRSEDLRDILYDGFQIERRIHVGL
jgi:hypothetical protein